jgi:hypothetical protein
MFRVLCETWDSTVPPLLGIGFPRHSSCRDSRLGCPGRAKPARVERTLLSVASDVDLDSPPPNRPKSRVPHVSRPLRNVGFHNATPCLEIGSRRHSSCGDSRLGRPGRAKPAREERSGHSRPLLLTLVLRLSVVDPHRKQRCLMSSNRPGRARLQSCRKRIKKESGFSHLRCQCPC